MPVSFDVINGGGYLSVTSASTNPDGLVESFLALGSTPGTNTVEVIALEITSPVIFTAQGVDNNQPPVVYDDDYSVDENSVLNIPAPGVLDNDNDPDDDTITAEKVSGPNHGTLVLNPDGSFVYTPEVNYHGTDSFTYQAFDGTEYSNSSTVNISVDEGYKFILKWGTFGTDNGQFHDPYGIALDNAGNVYITFSASLE